MKIIDLLNKIANGEELPKKFKMLSPVLRQETIFTYNNTYKAYFDNNKSPISMSLSDNLKNLNEEIEIIQDSEEIDIQNIKKLDLSAEATYDSDVRTIAIDNRFKINELLQAVKQLDNKINKKG